MAIPETLQQLVEAAIRAGELPGDPFIVVSTVAAAACFLCGIQLGTEAVVLKFSERSALLHTRCFTAWLEVVIAARQKPWPNGAQSAQECHTPPLRTEPAT